MPPAPSPTSDWIGRRRDLSRDLVLPGRPSADPEAGGPVTRRIHSALWAGAEPPSGIRRGFSIPRRPAVPPFRAAPPERPNLPNYGAAGVTHRAPVPCTTFTS